MAVVKEEEPSCMEIWLDFSSLSYSVNRPKDNATLQLLSIINGTIQFDSYWILLQTELTSGLNSATSNEVCHAIRVLADENRTVFCTIHLPSATVFDIFDMLVLLAAGKVVYFGNDQAAIKFFSTSKFWFHYDDTQNPADFVIAVAGSFVEDKTGNTVTDDMLVKHYEETVRCFEREPLNQKAASSMSSKIVGLYPTSFLKQFTVMFKRQGLKTLRNKLPLQISFFRQVFYLYSYTHIYIYWRLYATWLLYSDAF